MFQQSLLRYSRLDRTPNHQRSIRGDKLLYEIRLNDKPMLDENYDNLQDACKAYTTTVNILTMTRMIEIRVELVQRPTLGEYRVLALTLIGNDGSYETKLCNVGFNQDTNQFEITQEKRS